MKRTSAFLRLSALAVCLILIISQLGSCFEPEKPSAGNGPSVDEGELPDHSGGAAYVAVNGNIPYFEADDIVYESYEYYSELDGLGRCGVAVACIGTDIMPTEDREGSLTVTPSGWEYKGKSNNNTYSFVDGGFIYNRCHLIGYQLTGENSNEKNLITGTRYLNMKGMLPFENLVKAFVVDTEMHVMYRVTPIFEGNDYVAKGVLMEGYSVEDDGEGICFCIFAYNIQPGVIIDYYTGENKADPEYNEGSEETVSAVYVLNISTKKYHLPTCTYAKSMSSDNRFNYTGEPEDFKTLYPDYLPCGSCNPDQK
ncbi:MAG: DNA/RNA non-specific endonuclease [Clostridia bacterium]|nr:DNA/RNA non-specific endonuclease [Clostridia bacterium]